jgi:hypothetical protein
MPVEHSEPNEKNTLPANKPYGCSNPTYKDGYWVKTRHYFEDGRYEMRDEYVKHTMSTTARYDHSLTDQRCQFCNSRGLGEKYDEQVRRNGK